MKQENPYKLLHEGCQRLWFGLANGDDSNAIIADAYNIIGNPIVITTNYVLFKSIGVRTNALLDKLFMIAYDESVQAQDKPFYIAPDDIPFADEQIKYGVLCAGIVDKEQFYGRVMILGEHRFNKLLAEEYVFTLAKIMSKAFSAEVFNQINTYVPDFPLFHSFISGESLDSNRIRLKLEELNYVPESGMNIIVIDQRNQPLHAAIQNMKKFAELLSCKIYSLYHGNIVTINCRSHAKKLAASEAFRNAAAKQGFKCGVSREFYLLSNIPMMFDQAIFALNIGDFFDCPDAIIEYETYSAEYSICLAARENNPLYLLDPRLVKLKEYDDDGPGYLIDTLKTHLAHIKTPSEGAQALFIHRNTYFHRLDKIAELTGWDLSDGDCIAKVGFYMKIIQLLEQAERKNVRNLSSLIDMK